MNESDAESPSKRARGCLTALAVLAGLVALGLWAMNGNKSSLRSRLTLVIETPEGDKTGSSVSQVTVLSPGACNRALGFGSLSVEGEKGEAVIVDLGARGVLFASLANERAIRSGGLGMYNAAGGVRLKRAFIEITDEPLTTGIENRLPWLSQASNKRLIPHAGPRNLSDALTIDLLSYEDFRTAWQR